jgi:hypothetical protein
VPGRREAQTSIYETTLEKPELEEALKVRESMDERRSTANHNFKNADERARKLIDDLELGDDTVVRVGDFIISSKMAKGRDVAFKTDPQLRIRIKPIKT